MKIVQINTCTYGSTGKIMRQIGKTVRARGYECWMAVPKGRHNNEENSPFPGIIWIGNRFSEDSHLGLGRITGLQGCFSGLATYQFLSELNRINPDVIHIHNLHNSYINIPMLFKYIRKKKIRVVWTLHDCWAFTGHCPYFTMVKCEKWKEGCHQCPIYKEYPQSYFDLSRLMWKLKKRWFSGIADLIVVTPSQWLAQLAKQSFLKDYPVKVINNGIDLDIFKPTESNFRERFGIAPDKFIVLGVAFGWGVRKGLDVFIDLAKRLDDRFQIVLVGTDDKVDKQLPENITSIHRTQNQQELAEIYTAADVFVNPTREDNYPTVNMEAIACGTPVITFKTGGSPEMIGENCGDVVPCDDVNALECEILRTCTEKPYSKKSCLAHSKTFDKWDRYEEYITLYEQIE